jgi:hypothetical protein
VAASFHFEYSIAFSPESAAETLRAIPALPGVFALHGPPAAEGQAPAQPYLTHAADLRRRITRILAPPDFQSKRLNLRDHVARIDFTVTGSEFESAFTLYHATVSIFSQTEGRRRLRLHTPFFLRFTAENSYPRVYSTNRLSRRALAHTYGPFPSHAAADRYCDAVLDLFKLRRCYEDLAPYPEHPGCVYQEMNKCLAPCNQACTPAGAAAYATEAAAVEAFFNTRGESLLAQLTAEREQASADLDYERAAQLHAHFLRVKSAAALADPLVQPIPRLRAIIIQKAAQLGVPQLSSEMWDNAEPSAAVFLLASGCIAGPGRLSTLGVRAVKDQTSVGTSLYAQPLMLEAVPLADDVAAEPGAPRLDSETWVAAPESVSATALNPEIRASTVVTSLEQQTSAHATGAAQPDLATLSDHLSLLRRWYYRPEKQRIGEVFFPKEDGSWPIRRILNAAARASFGEPKSVPEAPFQQHPTPTEEVH